MKRGTMLDDDLKYVFYLLLVGISCALFISRQLALGLFVIVFLYSGMSGVFMLFGESGKASTNGYAQARQPQVMPATSAPLPDEPTIADQIKAVHLKNDFKCPNCGATVLPTDMICKHCGSVLVAAVSLPRPEKWSDIEVGQAVILKHPKQGEMNLSVQNRIYYGELWQAQMRPNVPWTLTGAYYVGLGLNEDLMLMNWQSRFYLLDAKQPLNDMSINRDFAPYARQFAASNQTAKVSFPYQNETWRMEDIGRFRVEYAEGDGIRVSPGAVGRFIHASDKNKVLVVEDYQTGGSGLDTLWTGYQIAEQDVQF
jgi:zinc ribbon protein